MDDMDDTGPTSENEACTCCAPPPVHASGPLWSVDHGERTEEDCACDCHDRTHADDTGCGDAPR
ncbi:hypothetical protein [Streptomyces sp. ODS28]|uniref:hypothetical protein n=1 Tax=Streptomyces sp. ODS28 TaxID=3136688 RepID=UPI0031EE697C